MLACAQTPAAPSPSPAMPAWIADLEGLYEVHATADSDAGCDVLHDSTIASLAEGWLLVVLQQDDRQAWLDLRSCAGPEACRAKAADVRDDKAHAFVQGARFVADVDEGDALQAETSFAGDPRSDGTCDAATRRVQRLERPAPTELEWHIEHWHGSPYAADAQGRCQTTLADSFHRTVRCTHKERWRSAYRMPL
ncbi:MAG: hypothetical protein ACPGUV_01940 [Polyangiales bacterium]